MAGADERAPAFFLVMDFEATCERDDRSWPNEIIEFPAVLLDARTLEVVSEFREFVRPTERPKLTAFCTELTGIQQDQVSGADILEGVLGRFDEWLRSHVADDEFALPVICGDWDLRQMLPKEARRKQLKYPSALRTWCNLKLSFGEATGTRAQGMAGMLHFLGLELVGRHHSGIDDARNIARILVELVRRFDFPVRRTPGGGDKPQAVAREVPRQAASKVGADAAARSSPAVGEATETNLVRKLRKRLQQMEALEKKQQAGEALSEEQWQKLGRLEELRRQLSDALLGRTPGVADAWDD
mmetsp:Transcript_88649/g.228640  ORF Transcript_88649/g.228640 Transcript_88649/m.228640 type:complete len:300 (-) Transcript_88649:130-1029(-)